MRTPSFRIGELVVAFDAPAEPGKTWRRHRAVVRAADGSCRACTLTVHPADELHFDSQRAAALVDVMTCARVPKDEPLLLHAFSTEQGWLALCERAPPQLSLERVIDSMRDRGVRARIAVGAEVVRTLAEVGEQIAEESLAAARFQPSDMGFDLDGRFRARPRWIFGDTVVGEGPGMIRTDLRGMAREVARGLPSTARSPMVAVGYAAFWLLTLDDPYGAPPRASLIELLPTLMRALPRPLASVRPDVPAPLAVLVDAMLDPEPSKRPASFAAIVGAIREVTRALPPAREDRAAFVAMLGELFPAEVTRAEQELDELAATDFEDLLARCEPLQGVTAIDVRARQKQKKPRGAPSPAALQADDDIVWEGDGREMRRVSARLCVDLAPVTCAAYARFVDDTGHRPPSDWAGDQCPPERAHSPVVRVSLEDARAYARWAKKRLPLNEDWITAMSSLGFAALKGGQVWEWTASRQRGGHVVRGGRFRDRRNIEPTPLHQSWEDGPADDVGFRCVADA